jgi:predicted cupin superfamily sugar epimerase
MKVYTIYFLLEGHDFSAFHRLKSDEIWAYNYGCPLTIFLIDEDGKFNQITLGDPENPIYQITIDANQWLAAEVNDKSSFTLMSCFVAPGFEYHDFELANRQMLVNQYPSYADLINRLTREK